MSGISSYAIKITAIHQYKKNSETNWTENNLIACILATLSLLQEYLSSPRGIPCMWDDKNDLLGMISKSSREHQANFLKGAIRALKDNQTGSASKEVWGKYFTLV